MGSYGSHASPRLQGHVASRNPAEWDNSWRMVTSSMEPKGSCTSLSSGTYFTIGSSSEISPRSRSCMIDTAVNVFVIDAQW